MSAVGYKGQNTEVWVIQFTGTTSGGFGTSAVKQYGTVYRSQGGTSVATGTLPFTLPSDQNGLVVDIYTNGAVPSSPGDFQFDIEVAQISQRLFIDANTINANQSTGRQFLSQPVKLPATAQLAFAAYWIVGQTAATASNVFMKVKIIPKRI
jgi:hypothetical protein